MHFVLFLYSELVKAMQKLSMSIIVDSITFDNSLVILRKKKYMSFVRKKSDDALMRKITSVFCSLLF